MRRLLLISLAAFALAAAPASGVQPRDGEEVAQLQARYRDAVVRLRRLEDEAATATRAAAAPAAVDAAPAADRTRLDALAAQEAPLLAGLTRLRATQGRLLGGLQRLTRRPPPALVVPVRRAVEARRAGLLMREAALALELRAAGLEARRAEVAHARRVVLLSQAGALAADSAAGERAAAAADRGAARRSRAVVLAAEARAARSEVAALAARLRRMGAEVPEVPAGAVARVSALPAGRDRLVRPVDGPPLVRFGRGAAGWRWTGTGGDVRAPAPGRVAHVGPHETWGTIVLLDLGQGWHVVLLGLGAASVEVDQRVEAGQSVGRDRVGGDLQFELRREETPVDPARFLEAR
ncbi:MAG TPA: peptidoglycan DD-metalloendopeptidase family protein [Brevundimonas sp.]|jgi:murein DD-endopeptidase MepM/ murein hydrolase activator NlpD|uniref:murein hydrolase activator EnvC family protein n=1 Tax=Brevundimonas sp. TaxID=1871086 RepID=UPI002DE4E5E4|nr:peptidoglycan DD-metalloendopeptidase family protein [Brevundimonas sp.]